MALGVRGEMNGQADADPKSFLNGGIGGPLMQKGALSGDGGGIHNWVEPKRGLTFSFDKDGLRVDATRAHPEHMTGQIGWGRIKVFMEQYGPKEQA